MITIKTTLKIETTSLEGIAGVPSSLQLQASNSSSSNVTWSLKEGSSLPSGLSLAKTGIIKGTPKNSGIYEFTVTAKNTSDMTEGVIRIYIAPQIKTSAKLSDTTVNSYLDFQIKLSDQKSIMIYSLTGGKLPEGLELDSKTGHILGTVKELDTNPFKFTVRAALKDYPEAYDEREFSLLVKGIAPQIITSSLPSGIENKPYSFILHSSGTTPLKWEASGLPDYLIMDTLTGEIARKDPLGKDTKKYDITITASNDWGSDSRIFSFKVESIVIKTDSIPELKVGEDVNYTIEAESAGALSYTLSWSGKKIGGLKLSGAKITGKPTGKAGTYKLKAVVSTGKGKNKKSVSKTFAIVLRDIAPEINTENLADAVIGQKYNKSFIEDTEGTASKTFTITLRDSEPKITTGNTKPLKKATIGKSYSQQIKASGTGLTWSLVTEIKGLNINQKGKISGIPLNIGNAAKEEGYPVTVTVSNSNEKGSDSKTFTIQLADVTKPKITTKTLTTAYVGEAYTQTITAEGAGQSWSLEQPGKVGKKNTVDSSKTIGGLKIDDKTGTISGTPSGEAGKYKLKVIFKISEAKSVEKTFTITLQDRTPKSTAAENSQENVKSEAVDDSYTQEQSDEEAAQSPNDSDSDENISELLEYLNANSDYSAGTSIIISSKKYIIACVLDSISVTESGQHDITAELDASAKTGAKLIWLANPVNAEPSEDDKIADFYEDNEERSPTEEVPESHKIIISPWLRAGVIYEPVIAVEVE